MSFKPNYLIIPLVVLATAAAGGFITSQGMDWYAAISLPSYTPPGSFIGTVWTILFVLFAISALIAWNRSWAGRKTAIGALFALNALLNVSWTMLFFGLGLIGPAVFEAALLGLSVLALIIVIWPVSKIASWLLLPYLAWVSFATFLTYTIWSLNR